MADCNYDDAWNIEPRNLSPKFEAVANDTSATSRISAASSRTSRDRNSRGRLSTAAVTPSAPPGPPIRRGSLWQQLEEGQSVNESSVAQAVPQTREASSKKVRPSLTMAEDSDVVKRRPAAAARDVSKQAVKTPAGVAAVAGKCTSDHRRWQKGALQPPMVAANGRGRGRPLKRPASSFQPVVHLVEEAAAEALAVVVPEELAAGAVGDGKESIPIANKEPLPARLQHRPVGSNIEVNSEPLPLLPPPPLMLLAA
eukprot:CAMPEP_0172658764 /NCGR_PEP_ID=MMETSP1074-20121228/2967_1 /TAXON_ID=2916 /ORGANISM="Ceratium fusus, Strain PA161109" /LENGTH=254 /DNA_ID=CAMNT_0013474097 /DNA_START=30 /DNA_END=792 /DNA_ORIENTATION=+